MSAAIPPLERLYEVEIDGLKQWLTVRDLLQLTIDTKANTINILDQYGKEGQWLTCTKNDPITVVNTLLNQVRDAMGGVEAWALITCPTINAITIYMLPSIACIWHQETCISISYTRRTEAYFSRTNMVYTSKTDCERDFAILSRAIRDYQAGRAPGSDDEVQSVA